MLAGNRSCQHLALLLAMLGHELVRHPVCKAHRLELGKSRWLFPGARAGRPMEPVSLSR